MKILITGGAGFIGSNFLNLLVPRHPEHSFVNLDALTYAANPRSLAALENRANYAFQRVDLVDFEAVRAALARIRPDVAIHFAAESHVDRSISGPRPFVRTNIEGTFNLLEACREMWKPGEGLFHHVSTDEVYGSLGAEGLFSEETPLRPLESLFGVQGRERSPGARLAPHLRHAGEDHQLLEQLRPAAISREAHSADDPQALERKPLPVYGKGENVRDWLYVERPLRGHLGGGRQGQTGRDLQHRRTQRAAQHRRRQATVRHRRAGDRRPRSRATAD